MLMFLLRSLAQLILTSVENFPLIITMLHCATASVDGFVKDGFSGFVGNGVPVPRKKYKKCSLYEYILGILEL